MKADDTISTPSFSRPGFVEEAAFFQAVEVAAVIWCKKARGVRSEGMTDESARMKKG
jgi:hypothetical protein